MGYNKAKEKKAWNKWKDKEEQLMKDLGVEENLIKELYQYDLKAFNANRRFLQRQHPNSGILDYATAKQKNNVVTLENLFDQLENEQLYNMLKDMQRMDLMIILFKLCGYKNIEIASFFQISKSAVSQRIGRIQKKLKKFLD